MMRSFLVMLLIGGLVLPACSKKIKAPHPAEQSSSLFSLSTINEARQQAYSSLKKQPALAMLSRSKKKQVSQDSIEMIQAKLVDIPIPLKAHSLPQFFSGEYDQSGVMLGYDCPILSDEIISFYQQEMERFGWQQVSYCYGVEWLLAFEKPSQFCTISIRPAKKGKKLTTVVISVGDKGSR